MAKPEKESRFMDGMLMGGLLGAALGVLFAPAAGENVRARLKQQLKNMDLDKIVARFGEAFEEGKKVAKKAVSEMEKE